MSFEKLPHDIPDKFAKDSSCWSTHSLTPLIRASRRREQNRTSTSREKALKEAEEFQQKHFPISSEFRSRKGSSSVIVDWYVFKKLHRSSCPLSFLSELPWTFLQSYGSLDWREYQGEVVTGFIPFAYPVPAKAWHTRKVSAISFPCAASGICSNACSRTASPSSGIDRMIGHQNHPLNRFAAACMSTPSMMVFAATPGRKAPPYFVRFGNKPADRPLIQLSLWFGSVFYLILLTKVKVFGAFMLGRTQNLGPFTKALLTVVWVLFPHMHRTEVTEDPGSFLCSNVPRPLTHVNSASMSVSRSRALNLPSKWMSTGAQESLGHWL